MVYLLFLKIIDKLFESSSEYGEDIKEYKKEVMNKLGLSTESIEKLYEDEFSKQLIIL